MTNSLRKPAYLAAFILIAACALLAATISCTKGATNKPLAPGLMPDKQVSDFHIPETGSLVLMLGPNGQLETFPGLADSQTTDKQKTESQPVANQTAGNWSNQGPEPAPFAVQTAIAAVQAPVDGGAVVAINRTGLVHLVIYKRQVEVRRIPGVDAEFTGRSVAQSWTWNGKAMFLLHYNEIFETVAVRSPVARVIAVSSAEALVLPAFGIEAGVVTQEDVELFGSPYAVFPREADKWLVQFRLADQEKTRTAFAAWKPSLDKADQLNPLEPLDRSVYEAEARPVSIREAPPALRLAADSLGGSLILDAVMPDGSQHSWLYGSVDTALAVRAWVSDTTVAALASDGRVVLVDADGTSRGNINPPVPGAYFRDIAMLDDFIIAVWEEDLFPDLGRSGLIIMDVAALKDRSNQLSDQPSQSAGN